MIKLQSETLKYSSEGLEMHGYVAWDAGIDGARPAVIVVHEWWGCNEYAHKRANMLAELGYVGMAIDLYGQGKTADNPDDAGVYMNEVIGNLPVARRRFHAALEALRQHPQADAGRVAAIGYCMGGGIVLHMARYGADLAAVASFHGSLGLGIAAAGEGGEVTARVVAYNGEADGFVSSEEISGLQAELDQAGADYHFIQLPGALHGFSNPAATARGEKYGLPLRYDALADQCSWAHMQMVLREKFSHN